MSDTALEEAKARVRELMAPPARICTECGIAISGTEDDFTKHIYEEARVEIKRQFEEDERRKKDAVKPNQQLKRLLESKL